MKEENIYIIGEINQEILEKTIPDLLDLDNEGLDNINIFISSQGGESHIGFAIYEIIKNMKTHITTIAFGEIMSIATVIYLAGNKRIVTKNTVFLLHSPYVEELYGDYEKIKIESRNIKKIKKKLIKRYLKHTNLNKSKLKKILSKDTYFYHKESILNGFAHSIYKGVRIKND